MVMRSAWVIMYLCINKMRKGEKNGKERRERARGGKRRRRGEWEWERDSPVFHESEVDKREKQLTNSRYGSKIDTACVHQCNGPQKHHTAASPLPRKYIPLSSRTNSLAFKRLMWIW
jgi:hypothetical protein